ncbi:Folate-Biopterin Transporter (FBT) Family [Achlya hypogyna]|uniref:Folate-Biopterin Transporter (FBT) Family n=1 Tax=Achlya hypogyna TaxID=1202772 RepID=A0A1V9YE39_ACHHY|nr:Folate-Biopterin Transporter (FBT) Family [Achlya hypogyna]
MANNLSSTECKDPPTDSSDIDFSVIEDLAHDPSTALAPGGALALNSRDAIVFYIQGIAASFLQWALPPMNTFLFAVYLHGSPHLVQQFTWLQWLGWVPRILFAMLSDSVTVFGYRRKFWLVLGWVIALASVGPMAFTSVGDPYCDPQVYPTCLNPKANTTRTAYNLDAPNQVAWYRTPTFFVHLGVAMVQATVDGVMVEYCQREPLATRGRLQAFTYFISGLGILYARFFGLFGLNAPRYGGTYDYSAGPNVAYIIGFALGAIALVLAVCCFRDTLNHIKSLQEWTKKLWLTLQNRAVYQLFAFRVLYSIFQSAAGTPYITWVTGVSVGWSNVMGRILYVPTLIQIMRRGLHWNWRFCVGVASVASILITTFVTFFVIYDVCRNTYFYYVGTALTAIALAVTTLMPGWVMVEIAGMGHEATIAALYGTMKDLSLPVAARWKQFMMDSFPANLALKDDRHTRNQVAATQAICLAIQLVGVVFVVFLPTHRLPTLHLLRQNDFSRIASLVVVIAYFGLIVFLLEQSLVNY